MKIVYTGKESQGKNYILASEAYDHIIRNKRWLKRTGYPSTMAFDKSSGSEEMKKLVEEAGLIYKEYVNLTDLLPLEEADIYMGEVLKFFPAKGSEPLTPEQIDFLTQGAKSGVFMYCASQDFSQVHKSFRLLVNDVYQVHKIMGSRRPIKRRPNSKYIWGMILARRVDPETFKGDDTTMKEELLTFPQIYFIRKKIVNLFKTNLKVPMTEHPPLIMRRQPIFHMAKDNKIVKETEKWKP